MSEKPIEQDEVNTSPENEEKWYRNKLFWVSVLRGGGLTLGILMIFLNLEFTIFILVPIISASILFYFAIKKPVSEGPVESPENKTVWYRNKFFWVGFIGWFVINGLAWIPMMNPDREALGYVLLAWGALFLVNIGALVTFAFTQRMIALGQLSAFAVNFVFALLLDMALGAICFVPFWVEEF